MRVLIFCVLMIVSVLNQVYAHGPDFLETKALAIHSTKQVISDDYTFFINQVRTDGSLLTSSANNFVGEFNHFVDEVGPNHIVTLYIDSYALTHENNIYLIPDDKVKSNFHYNKIEDYIDLQNQVINPILSKSPYALIIFFDCISIDKEKFSPKPFKDTTIFYLPLEDSQGNRAKLSDLDLALKVKKWPVTQFNQLDYSKHDNYCIYPTRDGSCKLEPTQKLASSASQNSPKPPAKTPPPTITAPTISRASPNLDQLAANCDNAQVNLTMLDLAVIKLAISNQCVSNEAYQVSVNGILYDGVFDENGKDDINLYPLEVDNNITVIFSDGSASEQTTTVRAVNQIDRMILSWQGNENLNLYVLKPGVSLGSGKEISGQTHCGQSDKYYRFDCQQESTSKRQVYTRSTHDKTKGKMIQFQVGYPCIGDKQNAVEFDAQFVTQKTVKGTLNSFAEQNCDEGTSVYFALRQKIDLRKP